MPASRYPIGVSQYGHARVRAGLDEEDDDQDDPDDDDDDSLSQSCPQDRIRRNYLGQRPGVNLASSQPEAPQGASVRPETIEVHLNEGFLSRERRFLYDVLANTRSKLSSMQMFNPARNQSMREQQESWDEKEKYTLDSLNEVRGPLDDKFQWNRSEDGREVWASKMQYFLAITSYSIGLGNVIRFPILVQKNGGLAFVVLFVIMLVLEGIPLFYLELAVGQRMRKAAISCWNLVSPFAAGIGIASALVSFLVGLYYNAMVAWTMLYLWDSSKSALSKSELPFSICPRASSSLSPSARLSNRTAQCQVAGPFQYFWFQETLEASHDVESGWSNPNWPVLISLCLAWLISYVCLAKGLSSAKRIVYLASTFPYVILSVFFLKALSLPGMADGVYYLFKPQWSKLLDPFVWLQAAAQVFFSLGLGFGGLIALSSYNPVNNNCYKDAVKVSVINFSTSIYAGIVIFAILGYKANLSNDRCLAEREQAIYFYLSDYNLKVLDYGSAFDPNGSQEEHKSAVNNPGDTSDFSMGILGDANEQLTKNTPSNSSDIVAKTSTTTDADYYDSSDALAAVRSLDRQLDKSLSGSEFDYGDSDVEFTINMSKLISKDELEKVIQRIPDLPNCNVQRELDGASQGTGLVFVVMTEAISHFRDAPVWTIIFFLMLLTLGLDSQFGNLEGLLSSVADLPLASAIRRQWFTGFVCCLSLIISAFFFAHSAGSYMFAIFDEYAGSFSLVLIALFELIAVSYIYGLKRFCDDCELMTGKRPPFIILLSWRFISPILLLVVIFATIREFTLTLDYEAWTGEQLMVKVWPNWCIVLGACLITTCVICIPAIALLRILKIKILPEEHINQCWFPADELREFHNIQEEHKVTKLERILFGFEDDD